MGIRTRRPLTVAVVAVLGASMLAGCGKKPGAAPTESADQFVARSNTELLAHWKEVNAAVWTQQTYINDDTQLLAARAQDRYLEYYTKAVKDAARYEGQQVSPSAARSMLLLKLGVAAPAPDDAKKRAELTEIAARMDASYGAGKYCPKGPESCRNLDELSDVLVKSRDYDAQLEAWQGWHTISRPMRKDYERFVELANEGSQSLGFKDLGEMWRSGYDMTPAQFSDETERLWGQVKPLYDQLHCYARGRLQAKYGKARVPDGKPIPAHLLGNMWAQQWNNVYDLLEPYPGVSDLDVGSALKKQGYDAVKMTRSAEAFYTSMGFPKLPDSFWTHSMLRRPQDREVVCHASAWSMDTRDDVRIKMCIQPAEEDLYTIYHELGHVYYYLSYRDQPLLFQAGANDGFHEAIGDTMNLSMTRGYLVQAGLVPAVKIDPALADKALINGQMKSALDKVAFLPFGKLIDQWRWGVFSGQIKPADYNKAWWELRRKYQGVDSPVARSEEDFDPGAKYHVPGNTPYTRYFLAYVLQFQFHKALCEAAGNQGQLHDCSVYGNAEAGKRFQQMLAMGASEPWQDAMEKLTGTRQMDGSAIIDYYRPLMSWLEKENAGRQCGW